MADDARGRVRAAWKYLSIRVLRRFLNRPPLHTQGAQKREKRHAYGDEEDTLECEIKRVQDHAFIWLLDKLHNVRGAFSHEESAAVQVRDLAELLEENVADDGLADGCGDSSAQLLEKEINCNAVADILLWQDGLDGQSRRLHAESEAEAGQELIRNPLRGGCIAVESRHKSLAQGHDGRGDKNGRDVVAGRLCEDTRQNGGREETEHQRECADACFYGGNLLDRLN